MNDIEHTSAPAQTDQQKLTIQAAAHTLLQQDASANVQSAYQFLLNNGNSDVISLEDDYLKDTAMAQRELRVGLDISENSQAKIEQLGVPTAQIEAALNDETLVESINEAIDHEIAKTYQQNDRQHPQPAAAQGASLSKPKPRVSGVDLKGRANLDQLVHQQGY